MEYFNRQRDSKGDDHSRRSTDDRLDAFYRSAERLDKLSTRRNADRREQQRPMPTQRQKVG